MSEFVKEIGVKEFDSEVIDHSGLVLVDFWAPWCGPCRMVTPILEEIAGKFSGQVHVCKVNVDNNGDLAMKYRVSGIPTLILFKDGKQVAQHVGVLSRTDMEKLITNNL